MKLTNEEKAQRELDCFMYCLYQSLDNFKNKNYGHAAVYLENAARSLKALALEELKESENQSDDVVTFIATIRSNDGNS